MTRAPPSMSPSHLQNALSDQAPSHWLWIVVVLMVVVFALDFSTPSDLILGYLYTVPLLLASIRLRLCRTAQVKVVAIAQQRTQIAANQKLMQLREDFFYLYAHP
jgi:hypothetical protein